MKYRYILFDADDTLLDFAKAEVMALRSLLRRYGCRCTENEEHAFVNLCDTLWLEFGLDNSVDPYISSHYHQLFYEYSVKRFSAFGERFHIGVPAGELSDQYLRELSQCDFLTDGAYETCRRLALECTLSVVTNGLWSMQKTRFDRSPIGRFISNLIVSENARYPKPDRRFFEYAMRESGIRDKAATLIVGDSLSNDICGGSEFGIDTCWLNPKSSRNNAGVVPTFEIGSLHELARILS
ncbi:MAG: HAD hydrolase-like protein [Clostridia bacterium]|nr:HAD hydrolase-like protein [Clostridia bacterium]